MPAFLFEKIHQRAYTEPVAPVNMDLKWFQNHLAYTISKYDRPWLRWVSQMELKNIISQQTLVAQNHHCYRRCKRTISLGFGEMLMKIWPYRGYCGWCRFIIYYQNTIPVQRQQFYIDEGSTCKEGITVSPHIPLFRCAVVHATDLFVWCNISFPVLFIMNC